VQPRRGTFVSPVEAADIVHITEVRAELEDYAADHAGRGVPPPGGDGKDGIAENQEKVQVWLG
jgi:DNA-binding GntR family transcriptional regulator